MLLVVFGLAGYSSLEKGPANLRLGSANAQALVVNQGGSVGSMALGRQGTIVKPISVPTSAARSHEPVDYLVQQGDDVRSVAAFFKLSVDDICGSNPQLASDPGLKPADRLQLPPVPGVVMTARAGDTAQDISRTYLVSIDGLLDYNYLRQPGDIKEGKRLVLPGGKGVHCPAEVEQGPPGARPAVVGAAGCPIRNYFVSQPFGPSSFEGFHAGIDLVAAYGAPIYAAADGVATANQGGYGYGNNVVIRVSAERTDLYGHMSRILVKSGQPVQAGDVIGLEGSTGFSTGAHLHYEVRINGVATNPAPLIRC